MIRTSLLLIGASLLLGACNNQKQNTEITEGRDSDNLYLGQTPPFDSAIAFAPGLVTTSGWEYGGVFTPDMKEFYFLRDADSITEFVVFKFQDSIWNEEVISKRVGQPYISPDGQTMHLGRRFKQRTVDGWSEVKLLEAPFDSLLIMRLTASDNGTYFFDEFKEDLTGDLRYSRIVDGQHETPQLLPPNINNGRSFHPFIAPDESYLIFDSTRPGGYGDSDIYISLKQDDGSWGDPINLGPEVNTPAWEAAATVTPDGKYLFFNRNVGPENYENVDIFWIAFESLLKD